MKAWHVTEADEAGKLLEGGMRPRSFWATEESLVDYYAEDYDRPVVLEIETDALDPDALGFAPDAPSIAEPIVRAIGKGEDEVAEEWAAVPGDGTWLDSVAVVGSFVVLGRIPASALALRDAPARDAGADALTARLRDVFERYPGMPVEDGQMDAFLTVSASWDRGRLVERYLHGQCAPFALAVHDATGWETVGIYTGPDGLWHERPIHVACLAPDGTYADARGHGLEEAALLAGYGPPGGGGLEVRPFPADEVRRIYASRTRWDHDLARMHAEALLPGMAERCAAGAPGP